MAGVGLGGMMMRRGVAFETVSHGLWRWGVVFEAIVVKEILMEI